MSAFCPTLDDMDNYDAPPDQSYLQAVEQPISIASGTVAEALAVLADISAAEAAKQPDIEGLELNIKAQRIDPNTPLRTFPPSSPSPSRESDTFYFRGSLEKITQEVGGIYPDGASPFEQSRLTPDIFCSSIKISVLKRIPHVENL